MVGIRLKVNESPEIALKKLKKQMDRSGILRKKRQSKYYAKPSILKREKSKEASKRRR